MSVWAAVGWGAFSSASLYLGQALAGPMRDKHRATGEVMGFGAGSMLSAVAYELIPESSLSHGPGIGIGVALGALVYFVGDRLIDRGGGADRQSIDAVTVSASGAAMFLGAPGRHSGGLYSWNHPGHRGIGQCRVRRRRLRLEHSPRHRGHHQLEGRRL
jgi:hypothetical protein